jgi:hypothetical protein
VFWLRIQRFKNFESEWMLLKYSFSGAGVLFHVKQPRPEP